MPIYVYKCEYCQRVQEEFRRVHEIDEVVKCEGCGRECVRQITQPANAYVSGYPYYDNVLGLEISDPGHRRKVLKQQGLIERG